MSMVATPSREPVHGTRRLSMSPGRRARILALYDGRCAARGCAATDSLEIDHVIPLELGGADEDFNLEPLCADHHRVKTARDRRAIAKAKRLAGETCAGPTKRPMRSRGFDKRLSRGFDNKVRAR